MKSYSSLNIQDFLLVKLCKILINKYNINSKLFRFRLKKKLIKRKKLLKSKKILKKKLLKSKKILKTKLIKNKRILKKNLMKNKRVLKKNMSASVFKNKRIVC